MILFDLKCRSGHVFESWFRDGETFDRVAAMGGVECPECGSLAVEKALMAPHLHTREHAPGIPAPRAGKATERREDAAGQPLIGTETAGRLLRALETLKQHIEKHFTDVGRKFPEEARKIHYGETERKNIFGAATPEEIKELQEEGIDILRLPVVVKGDA